MPTLTQSLSHLNIEDIPWTRLTTAYGRGTEIPEMIRERRYRDIGNLIEHQGTLWQVTPWALLFLLRESAGRRLDELSQPERFLYDSVWEAIEAVEESGQEIPEYPADPKALLREELLWSEIEDEEEDESEWEEEEMRGYDPSSFAAYFVYSRMLLEEAFDEYGQAARERERSE